MHQVYGSSKEPENSIVAEGRMHDFSPIVAEGRMYDFSPIVAEGGMDQWFFSDMSNLIISNLMISLTCEDIKTL